MKNIVRKWGMIPYMESISIELRDIVRAMYPMMMYLSNHEASVLVMISFRHKPCLPSQLLTYGCPTGWTHRETNLLLPAVSFRSNAQIM